MRVNKTLASLIIVLFSVSIVLGQSVKWGRQLITTTQDSMPGGAIVVDPNDDVYLAITRASNASSSSPKNPYLLKFNQAGQQLWSKQLGKTVGKETLRLTVQGLDPGVP